MTFNMLLGAIPLLGVIAGLARVKYPRVPFVTAGLVVVAYGISMAVAGVWAAQCWDCRGMNETRGDFFILAAFFLGLIAFTMLLGIWLGARLVTVLHRLLQTWRELRGDTSDGDSGAATDEDA
jgi:hypothetical protein